MCAAQYSSLMKGRKNKGGIAHETEGDMDKWQAYFHLREAEIEQLVSTHAHTHTHRHAVFILRSLWANTDIKVFVIPLLCWINSSTRAEALNVKS